VRGGGIAFDALKPTAHFQYTCNPAARQRAVGLSQPIAISKMRPKRWHFIRNIREIQPQASAPMLRRGGSGLATAMASSQSRKGIKMKQFVLIASMLVSASVFANDIDPMGFEQEHFSSTMSRDEAAVRSNTPLTLGNKFDDVGRVASPPSTKTRAEVAAETQAAQRLGLMSYGEQSLARGTAEQEEQIKVAGQRAVHNGTAGN